MCHPITAYRPSAARLTATTDLVDQICHERTRFEAWLKSIGEDRLVESPAGGGWTVCDHLQHLNSWRRVLLDVLQERLSPAAIPNDPAFDFARQTNQPAAVVLNAFRAVHLDSLAEVAFQPNEALARSSGLSGLTVGDFIAALTCEHDRRHREALSTDLGTD